MSRTLAGAIVHQLRTRYARDAIYTSIGTILVSINPYKLLSIYGRSDEGALLGVHEMRPLGVRMRQSGQGAMSAV